MKSLRSFWSLFGVVAFFIFAGVSSVLGSVQVDLSSGNLKGHITYDNGRIKSPGVTFIQVVSGFYASYGLDSNGNVWAWGTNVDGLLGSSEGGVPMEGENNFHRGSRVPIRVRGPYGIGYLTGVIKISASDTHVLALKSDGTVWAWGNNYYGQLGNGKDEGDYESYLEYEQFPVQVLGIWGEGNLSGIVDIAAGSYFSLAVDSNGYVYSWGLNDKGQLGGGDNYGWNKFPRFVYDYWYDYLTNVISVSAGAYHSLALKSDGTVWAWGWNTGWGEDGYLGTGFSEEYLNVAYPVKGPGGSGYLYASQISAGFYDLFSLALKSDGTVWGWGSNYDGQLGQGVTGSATPIPYPVQVLGSGGSGYLTNIIAISAGSYHSLALRNDGTVWAWGWNGYGQIGQGNWMENYSYPVQVKSPDGSGYLTNATGIGKSNGGDNSFAITSGGVFGWGMNYFAQLGNGSCEEKDLPTHLLLAGYATYSLDLYNNPIDQISVLADGRNNIRFLFSPDGNSWYWWNSGSGWQSINYELDTVIWDDFNIYLNPVDSIEALSRSNWISLLGQTPSKVFMIVWMEDPSLIYSINISNEGTPPPPFPDFTIKSWDSTTGNAPLTVVFSAEATEIEKLRAYYAAGHSFNYTWDFGDGSPVVSGKRVVGHTYKVAGTYTVTLFVKDELNNSESNLSNNTVQVVVSQPSDLTVRHFKVYYSNKYMRVPLKVIIKPVLEYMPGLEKVQSNEWKVGTDFVAQNRSQAVITFTQPGDFSINFSGQTNYGRSLMGSFPLNVKPNQLPTCTMSYEDYPQYGYTKFTPSCSDSDGKVKSYYWEFGNGETSKNRIGYAHYSQGGSYTVNLKVKDDSNEEANFQWDISIQR